MATRQSAALDRKKVLADPIMVSTIVVLITFLTLFILYPLAMLLTDSVHVRETNLIPLESILSGEAEVDYLLAVGNEAVAVSREAAVKIIEGVFVRANHTRVEEHRRDRAREIPEAADVPVTHNRSVKILTRGAEDGLVLEIVADDGGKRGNECRTALETVAVFNFPALFAYRSK